MIEPSGGSAGRHFIDLTRELAARGHAMTAIYSSLRAEARFLDELAGPRCRAIPLAVRRSLGPYDLAAIRALNKVFRGNGPFDIVHGYSSKAGALIRLVDVGWAKRVYKPHAFRGLDPRLGLAARELFSIAETALGLHADALITVSHDEEVFARSLRIPTDHIFLVRNGVINPRVIDRDATRAALGPSERLVGFVGRMSAQKNSVRFVHTVIPAMRAHPGLRDDWRGRTGGPGR